MGAVVELNPALRPFADDAPGAVAARNGWKLAIIVPTLNERDNVAPLVRALDAVLPAAGVEIIFVDDWSSDGTAQAVTALARGRADIRLIRRHGRRGLASAVIEGMLATTAPIVAVIDADLQHDEAILPALVALVATGAADIAIGSRYHPDGSCTGWSARRAWTSRIATRLAHLALGERVADPLSGFFVLRQDIVANLAPGLSGRGFKILLDILGSSPAPLKVAELPYRFRTRSAGASKLGVAVTLDYFRLLASKGARRLLANRAARFGLVGLSGLATNLLVLDVALRWLPFARAQAVAVLVAIAYNFLLNNRVTFGDRQLRGRHLLVGLLSFYLVCGLGALANVGLAAALFAGGRRWWLAAVAGAVVGSGWNFLASSALTWRTSRPGAHA